MSSTASGSKYIRIDQQGGAYDQVLHHSRRLSPHTRQDQIRLSHYDHVVAGNEDAAGAGDSSVWHDNFAFEQNQRDMHKLAARVSDLKEVRAQMTVIDLPKNPVKVGVGTVVSIEDQESGQTSRYFIAGFEDGDPLHDRLSYTAPLASVLLGAEVGEMRTFQLNRRTKEFAILAIEEADKGEDL